MRPHPEIPIFIQVRNEAVIASPIEGTWSSLHDLLRAGARILTVCNSDTEEVLTCMKTMKHGLQWLPQSPVTVRLICEIREISLDGARGS